MLRFKNFISEGLIKVPQKILKKFEKSLLEFAFSHMVAEVDLEYVDAVKKVARKNGVRSFKKPQKETRVKYKRPDIEIPVKKEDDYMDIDPVDNLHLFMVFNEKEIVHNADYDTDHEVTGEPTITVYVSNYVRDIREAYELDEAVFMASQIVTKLKADLKHEMMHFVQDIYLVNKHEKQNQQKRQSGKNTKQDKINYFTSQQEFDPTIQSEIGEFIATSSFQPSLEKHIKQSDFFNILKKHQPKKYRIAISKFTVGVNQYLNARKKK